MEFREQLAKSDKGTWQNAAAAVIAMVMLTGITTSYAQEGGDFFDGKEDGWFWYEDPPIVPEEQEEIPTAPQTPSQKQTQEQGPEPMSVEWLTEQLPALRNQAIDNPTHNNVLAYRFAERIMMDKAQAYSDMSRQVTELEPLLDENLRVPFASAAKAAMMGATNQAKDDLLAELAELVGVWVFYEQECTFCQEQIAPLNRFVKEHGFKTTIITKDGVFLERVSPEIRLREQTGQFTTLKVDFTPTIMMVQPPNEYFVVSQGFVSMKALEDRMLAAAHRYGLLTDEDYNRVQPTRQGLLAVNEIESENVNWDDKEQWVPYLKEQLREAYGLDAGERQ